MKKKKKDTKEKDVKKKKDFKSEPVVKESNKKKEGEMFKGSKDAKPKEKTKPSGNITKQQTQNINASPAKKKKLKENVKTLKNVNPKNIVEAKEMFFANDCKVNPIFEYENPQLAQKAI